MPQTDARFLDENCRKEHNSFAAEALIGRPIETPQYPCGIVVADRNRGRLEPKHKCRIRPWAASSAGGSCC